MRYKWQEKELQDRLEKAKTEKDFLCKNNYKGMIDLLHGKIDIMDLPTKKSAEKDSFMTRYKRYHENIEYLAPDMIDFFASIFSIETNEDNLFENIPFAKLELTNKELIDLCYEILESLEDKDLMETYKELINPYNHYLNLMDFKDFLSGITREINGLTFYDLKREESYISVHRHHNVEDVKALVHEVLHAYFYKKYKENPYVIHYFGELEGRFGNRQAANYLLKHNMKHYGNELRIAELFDILNDSYILFLNNVLFVTAKDYHFRLKEATNNVKEETGYQDTIISSKDLPYIFSVNCFVTATEILDYLVCLEAEKKHYKPKYQFDVIKEVRENDNPKYVNKVMRSRFKFFNENVQTLRRYKRDCERYIEYKN